MTGVTFEWVCSNPSQADSLYDKVNPHLYCIWNIAKDTLTMWVVKNPFMDFFFFFFGIGEEKMEAE